MEGEKTAQQRWHEEDLQHYRDQVQELEYCRRLCQHNSTRMMVHYQSVQRKESQWRYPWPIEEYPDMRALHAKILRQYDEIIWDINDKIIESIG